jgi:hypothetical protein
MAKSKAERNEKKMIQFARDMVDAGYMPVYATVEGYEGYCPAVICPPSDLARVKGATSLKVKCTQTEDGGFFLYPIL